MSKDYERIAEKFWSLPQKPGEEVQRGQLFMDDQILHDHLEREIRARLVGVETVLDAGGGTGRFSLWLAKMGYQVTHLDISEPMLQMAKQRASEMKVEDQITFVHGRLTELSRYTDGQFDLVLSLDAPISYTYPKHEDVVRELVRVAGRAALFCVSSRLGSYPFQFHPAGKRRYITDENSTDSAVRWYMKEWEDRGHWEPDFLRSDRLYEEGLFDDPDEVFRWMEEGGTPWPVTYLFRPEEMEALCRTSGLREVKLAGPGALARSLPGDILRKLLYTEANRELFLARCYRFDSEPSVCGLGLHSLVVSGVK